MPAITTSCVCGPRSEALGLLDDILLQRRNRSEDLVLLLRRHAELVEGTDEIFDRGIPVRFADAQSRVRGLRVAAGVDARSAGYGAELVDDVLADALDRIGAAPGEELRELRIARELAQEIVGDGGECIVSANALVERGRRLLRHGLLRGGRRGDCAGEDQGGEGGEELHASSSR